MSRLPELPLHRGHACLQIRRQQSGLRFERSQVLNDRVRFPENEAVVFKNRHALVGIERSETWRLLVLFREIDEGHFVFDA